MARARHKLVLSDEGVAELFTGNEQVWASDSDEELAEVLGARALNLESDDIGEVLDHLVKEGHLSDFEADRCVVETPDDDEQEPRHNEDEDEDEELAE